MISEKFEINSENGRMGAIQFITEKFAGDVKLDKKQTLQICLLTEETIGMVKSMVEDFSGEIWFSGNASACEIHLQATADMDRRSKHELIAVSTTGKNAATKGFMGMLGEVVSNALYNVGHSIDEYGTEAAKYGYVPESAFDTPAGVPNITPIWTLTNYRAVLDNGKDIDETAKIKLDDLEKSIVASIADEITVGVKGDEIELVIAKDFNKKSENKKPRIDEITTERLSISNKEKRVTVAKETAEYYALRAGLNQRDTMHLCLLVEETLGMVRAMTGEFEGQLWLQGDNVECRIHIEAETQINEEKKRNLIEASTSGKNSAPKGFMAKIGEMLFGAYTVGDEDLSEYMYEDIPEYMYYGMMRSPHAPTAPRTWSLITYRNTLEHEQTKSTKAASALDELEKSIVGKLADDVVVGVKGNKVELIIKETFANG